MLASKHMLLRRFPTMVPKEVQLQVMKMGCVCLLPWDSMPWPRRRRRRRRLRLSAESPEEALKQALISVR